MIWTLHITEQSGEKYVVNSQRLALVLLLDGILNFKQSQEDSHYD